MVSNRIKEKLKIAGLCLLGLILGNLAASAFADTTINIPVGGSFPAEIVGSGRVTFTCGNANSPVALTTQRTFVTCLCANIEKGDTLGANGTAVVLGTNPVRMEILDSDKPSDVKDILTRRCRKDHSSFVNPELVIQAINCKKISI